jgi:DNA-binding transcriptional MocR family regulator
MRSYIHTSDVPWPISLTRARPPSRRRSLAGQFTGVPGVIALTAGFPPPHLFPLAGISLRLQDGTSVDLGDASTSASQQYNSSLRGQPALAAWAAAHTAALHRPPAAHETLITNGGNHTLELITSLFLDRGDALLLEEYSYPVLTESIAAPKGYRTLGVPIDAGGIVPAGLRAVLEAAAAAAAAGGPPRPKLLYTVPVGQNPTGCTISDARRAEVYALCRAHDVWIVEDDPYFYLQWGAEGERAAAAAVAGGGGDPAAAAPALLAAVPGLAGLAASAPAAPCRSYLSLDVDGRVIRVDSFAKFLAPGLRLGWVTARADVVAKLTSALHAHTVGPCGLSQGVAAAMLGAWGDAGLEAHLRRVQAEYARRAATAAAAAARELGGVADWAVPRAGMFLWVRLVGVEDAGEVWQELRRAKVVCCPGGVMHCSGGRAGERAAPSPFLRISYSAASEAELEEGFARLGRVLRQRRASSCGAAGGGGGGGAVVVDVAASTGGGR